MIHFTPLLQLLMILLVTVSLGSLCIVVPDADIERSTSIVVLATRCWVLIVDWVKPLSATLVAPVVQRSRNLLQLFHRNLLLLFLCVDFDWLRLSLGLRSNCRLCLVSECHVRLTNDTLFNFAIRILWDYMLLQVIPGLVRLAARILVHGQILWRMWIGIHWIIVILPEEGLGENICFCCNCAAANTQLPGIDGY